MSVVRTSDDLLREYNDYYADGSVFKKRSIAAKQSLGHFMSLVASIRFKNLIDVGCGDGSFLIAASKVQLADVYYGVEISDSGISSTVAKNIPNLKEVQKFDGYHIPYADKAFDIGVAIHVLEHVEHERLFLSELARVCRKFYVEVPMEDTARLERSVKLSGKFGHINFYSERRFLELLRSTSGISSIESYAVFAHDLEYEIHLGGSLRGRAKYLVRKGLLRLFPRLAKRQLVYMLGVVCVSS